MPFWANLIGEVQIYKMALHDIDHDFRFCYNFFFKKQQFSISY